MELHHPHTAGKLLVRNVPTVLEDQTIRHVEAYLMEHDADFSSIDYIYIVNSQKHLKGVISIKDLFRMPKGTRISDVMTKDIVVVHPHTDQERVALLALEQNIKSVPVVNKHGMFLGIVPSDVILDVVHAELTEDVYSFAGIESKEFRSLSALHASPFSLLKARLPWLLVGLVGGIGAAQIVGYFEGLLEGEIALISFLPLMVYMSDAVGGQSQTIFIRALAMEPKMSFAKYFIKEMLSACLIAIALSTILFAVIGWSHTIELGLILAFSLAFTVLASVIVAIVTPSLLVRLGKDPAIGSGPFATIIRDIMSIVIYFVVANALMSLI